MGRAHGQDKEPHIANQWRGTVPTDNEQVTQYLESVPSPQKEICRSLREMIGTKFPQLSEEFKWNRPVYSSQSGKRRVLHGGQQQRRQLRVRLRR